MSHAPNHYERLKVTPDAPPEVIRAAYRALAAKLHPDRKNADVGPGDREHDDMAALNASYLVLMDAKSRAEYDQQLQGPTDQSQSDGVTASRFRARQAARAQAAAQGAASAGHPTIDTRFTQTDEAGDTRVDIDWLMSAPVSKRPWHPNPRVLMLAVSLGSMLVSGLVWWAMDNSEQAGVEMAMAQQGLPDQAQPGAPQSTDAMAALQEAQRMMGAASGVQPAAAAAAPIPQIPPEKLAQMSDAELLALMPQLVQDTEAAKALQAPRAEDKGPHPLDGNPLPGLKLAFDLPGAPLPKAAPE